MVVRQVAAGLERLQIRGQMMSKVALGHAFLQVERGLPCQLTMYSHCMFMSD